MIFLSHTNPLPFSKIQQLPFSLFTSSALPSSQQKKIHVTIAKHSQTMGETLRAATGAVARRGRGDGSKTTHRGGQSRLTSVGGASDESR